METQDGWRLGKDEGVAKVWKGSTWEGLRGMSVNLRRIKCLSTLMLRFQLSQQSHHRQSRS